jgi:Rrf2 family protein
MTKSSRFVIAAHVLTLLAAREGKPMTSDGMAGSVNTNPVVIRRLLALLARASLVSTQEGAKGGTRLARPAEDIDLLTVFRAVESGGLFALHAHPPNPACPVGCKIQAALLPTLEAAEAAMQQALASTTIAELVDRLQIPVYHTGSSGLERRHRAQPAALRCTRYQRRKARLRTPPPENPAR